MIILHHLENSRSHRIIWLLEELGLDYEIRHSARDPETKLGPSGQTDVHGQGTWPLIEHDGVVLGESGAITEYLIEVAGADEWRKRPGDANWPDYLYWLHFSEASLQPLSLIALILSTMAERAPFLVKPVLSKAGEAVTGSFLAPRNERYLSLINDQVKTQAYLVGDNPTGADIMMSFALETSASRFGSLEKYPHAKAYLQRIHERPAYQRALEKSGRYDFA